MTQHPPLTNHWQIAPRLTPEADEALNDFHPILRQVLFNRGYPSQEAALLYLEARQPPGCDPFNLLGVPEAVERITAAIQQKEPVAIYGDYDADGVTATALLVQALTALGADVRGYIPNRFDEGYGLNLEALDQLHAEGVRLIITVDCGIRSLPEINYANDLGLDFIITDHHHPGEELPQAVAIINPKQPNDTYPEKDLAGVGLAYKLASALIQRLEPKNLKRTDLLDLVALGTVADLVPLVGENRALVRVGLKCIRASQRPGLRSLLDVTKQRASEVRASHIGFILGPRLNAAGRVDSALDAYNLLIAQDAQESYKLAQQLEGHNRNRQSITRTIQIDAEQMALEEDSDALLLFAAHSSFNPGVVGLAASRLSERYYRPAIVAHRGETHTRASCRSISEFHITQALDQCADLLDHHGGHAAAAGFTVQNDNVDELLSRLRAIAHQQLDGLELRPILHADSEVFLSDLTEELVERLDLMNPTGYGNRQAAFITRDLEITQSRAVGRENSHLKFVATDGWDKVNAIAFRQAYWLETLPDRVDLLYNFELNVFNGRKNLQMNVRDIRKAEG